MKINNLYLSNETQIVSSEPKSHLTFHIFSPHHFPTSWAYSLLSIDRHKYTCVSKLKL